MNCKKCYKDTDGDILCSSCSVEETTSKINIEENFTQDNSKNDKIKRGIFTVLTFILVSISMLNPNFFVFWFLYATLMEAAQGQSSLLAVIITLIALGIVLACLNISHWILTKLKIMEKFLSEKLYKGLCNVLCGYFVFLIFSAIVPNNPISLTLNFISDINSSTTQIVKNIINFPKIDAEIPFYTIDNYWEDIELFFVDEKIYVSYKDNYNNDFVVKASSVNNKNITVSEEFIKIGNTILDKIYMIKDGANVDTYMQIYTNKFGSEIYFCPENTENFYSLDMGYTKLKNKIGYKDSVCLGKIIHEYLATAPVSSLDCN